MRRTGIEVIVAIGLLLTVLVAAAACSSDSDESAATEEPTPSSAADAVAESSDSGESTTAEESTPSSAADAVAKSSAESQNTIVFSDLNWTSAQLQNRIAQYIIEKGYGYPTDVVFGTTLPLLSSLINGDTHVTMEVWFPNQEEAWAEPEAKGEVVSIGGSLGNDWQSAFVIPAYLQQEYPELDDIQDLKEDKYKALFATPETDGKVRLMSCVIGWSCEEVNDAQIASYGLNEHIHIVNPVSGAEATADLYDAYDKGEPWIGFQWGTNEPALILDLVRLEEPPYSDECWLTTKACGYEDATILIGVNSVMMTRAPDVVDMLRNWEFGIDIYRTLSIWMDQNTGADVREAALWWLNGSIDIWGNWVTPEAKSAILAALAEREVPDGWPED